MKIKRLLLLLITLFALVALVACGTGDTGGGNGGDEAPETYRVMVTVNDGATVTSDNPVEVEDGGKATFSISIESGYAFDSTTHGTYDVSTGVLTLENITERVTVDFNVRKIDYGSSAIVYDLNGGNLSYNTFNSQASSYRYSMLQNNRLVVTFTSKYTDVVAAASTFYDDGTFYRNGYVLAEYNTKADGSGEGYSLGSKIAFSGDESGTVLYCIWEKASEAAYFTFEEYNYPCPVTPEKAPDWIEDGIIITGYSGNESKIVIPERIGTKYVIGIAEGAFKNLGVETLVLSRRLQIIEDGAFVGCSSLKTVYYPDGLYSISDAAFDEASYTSLKSLYVNATLAPRFSTDGGGAFALKLARLLGTEEKNRVIVIAGSSAYQGLATEYMEALFGGSYKVINFGTTRTTNGIIYLEAMSRMAHEGDIVLYAPENSSYMMGETELYFKTLRDMEGMNNFFRYIDISNYTKVFSSFADFNQNYRYTRAINTYEDIVSVVDRGAMNEYGDCLGEKRKTYCDERRYTDVYHITLNNRYKSINEGAWDDKASQEANKDFTDENNITWCTINEGELLLQMNRAITAAKTSGAKICFSFCPVDGTRVVSQALLPSGALNPEWLDEYERILKEDFVFDAVIGNVESYVFAHEYFYDNAFHLNDYGRALRTYQLYRDVAAFAGISNTVGIHSKGTEFEGCIFENSETPLYIFPKRNED